MWVVVVVVVVAVFCARYPMWVVVAVFYARYPMWVVLVVAVFGCKPGLFAHVPACLYTRRVPVYTIIV